MAACHRILDGRSVRFVRFAHRSSLRLPLHLVVTAGILALLEALPAPTLFGLVLPSPALSPLSRALSLSVCLSLSLSLFPLSHFSLSLSLFLSPGSPHSLSHPLPPSLSFLSSDHHAGSAPTSGRRLRSVPPCPHLPFPRFRVRCFLLWRVDAPRAVCVSRSVYDVSFCVADFQSHRFGLADSGIGTRPHRPKDVHRLPPLPAPSLPVLPLPVSLSFLRLSLPFLRISRPRPRTTALHLSPRPTPSPPSPLLSSKVAHRGWGRRRQGPA